MLVIVLGVSAIVFLTVSTLEVARRRGTQENVIIKKVIKAQNFMRTVFTFLSTLQLCTVKIILSATLDQQPVSHTLVLE